MCGFVGWISNQNPIDVSHLYNANESIKKRGPDDEGYLFIDNNDQIFNGSGIDTNNVHKKYLDYSKSKKKAKIGLAHRRLSVIDLSHNAHQPMKRKNIVLLFNGEIYNYKSLYETLKSSWKFKSQSDTEVILAAYNKWGDQMFDKLEGMWAIALLDIAKNKLLLSRDRFGEKPLYIYQYNKKIVFGSEIKAILSSGIVKFEPNLESVKNFIYLSNNKFHENFRKTLFHNISEVMPSTTLTISLEDSSINSQKYFNIHDLKKSKKNKLSNNEIEKIFEKNFSNILHADVPVALLLSGGIDSSIACILAAKILGKNNVTAYTSMSNEKDPDFQNSLILCKNLGIKQICVNQSQINKSENIKDILTYYDEPPQNISGGAIGGMTLYKEIAKDGFKVVIEGNGADEIFTGYMHYFILSIFYEYLKKGNILKSVLEVYKWLKNENASLFWFFNILIQDLLKKFLSIHKSIFIKSIVSKNINIFKNISNKNINLKKLYNQRANMKIKRSLFDLKSFFLYREYFPYYLTYADQNSSFSSMESRQPFLLKDIYEIGMTLPLEQQVKDGYGKYILRKIFNSKINSQIFFRKKKQGFTFNSSDWVFENKTKILESINSSIFMKQIINYDKFYSLIMEIDSEKIDTVTSMAIWRIYSICEWHKIQKKLYG